MRMYDIAVASQPLQKLIEQDLPLRKAYELAMLVTKLNPLLSFYGAQLMQGRDQAELNSLEIDLDVRRVELTLDTDVKLSAGDIKCLEPFVLFTEATGDD